MKIFFLSIMISCITVIAILKERRKWGERLRLFPREEIVERVVKVRMVGYFCLGIFMINVSIVLVFL